MASHSPLVLSHPVVLQDHAVQEIPEKEQYYIT